MSNNLNGLSIKKRSPLSACANRGLLSSASEAEEVPDLLPERRLRTRNRHFRSHAHQLGRLHRRSAGHRRSAEHSRIPLRMLPQLAPAGRRLVHFDVLLEAPVDLRATNGAALHLGSPFCLRFEIWIARPSCGNFLSKSRSSGRPRSERSRFGKQFPPPDSSKTASLLLLCPEG